jgi:sec-independent protein translocase protein TatB
MFDIGWGELVVIGIVALIAIGPKELPGVLRSIGQWMGKIRRMSAEFQGQFQEAMREAEMADLKKQADDIKSSVTDFTNFDPLATTSDTSSATASADAPPAPEAAPQSAPEAEALPQPAEQTFDVPLPEPPLPVTNADFAPPTTTPEPPPAKIAGSGA